MTAILFTTTDVRGPRRADFERLLASIEASRDVAIRHYVLLQNASEADLASWRRAAPACCRIDHLPGRVSLSEARNRMITRALSEADFGEADWVGFPDDDCWFPPAFLGRLSALFSGQPTLDVLVCRASLDPDARGFDVAAMTPMQAHEAIRLASSNNMFFRGPLIARIGRFDPELGLGTASGGGEDTDYLIRAYLLARSAGLIDRPLVGHPPPDRDSAAKYFHGALIVLAYHARSNSALTREFLRKILVGFYFTVSGKLSVRRYRRALAEGARAVVTRRYLEPVRRIQ